MNTNRKNKIVEVKNIKTDTIKVKFRSKTTVWNTIFDKDIEVRDHVIYILSAGRKHFEKAIVVETGNNFIKIEYLGVQYAERSKN